MLFGVFEVAEIVQVVEQRGGVVVGGELGGVGGRKPGGLQQWGSH